MEKAILECIVEGYCLYIYIDRTSTSHDVLGQYVQRPIPRRTFDPTHEELKNYITYEIRTTSYNEKRSAVIFNHVGKTPNDCVLVDKVNSVDVSCISHKNISCR